MTDAPPPAPDLTKAPNFDALIEWVRRLQRWSTEAVQRMGEDAEKIQDLEAKATETTLELEGKVREAEGERDEAQETLASLVEFVSDVQRRIRTGPELFDFMRRNGWLT